MIHKLIYFLCANIHMQWHKINLLSQMPSYRMSNAVVSENSHIETQAGTVASGRARQSRWVAKLQPTTLAHSLPSWRAPFQITVFSMPYTRRALIYSARGCAQGSGFIMHLNEKIHQKLKVVFQVLYRTTWPLKFPSNTSLSMFLWFIFSYYYRTTDLLRSFM